jgi:hypothetical protein
MNEIKKTAIFAGVAVVLALLAFISAPGKVTPEAFLDQGESFYPEFTDPNTATSLEVIDYNGETGQAIPFKVVFEEGKWSIPSHYDYPADGKERLAKTAAGVIQLRKDDFRSDNVADHELCGVIDPLDETSAALEGRGKRVTIRGENDRVLADIIIGNEITDREGFRFVRVPGQKRVYAARVDLEISTKFSDWIEADLLKVDKNKIEQVVLKDYSINERSGTVDQRDVLRLAKDGDSWKANKVSASQEVNKTKTDELLKALDELTIVGVRPKPQGLTRGLTKAGEGIQISTQDMLSLQSKGYFFTRDGSLLSNEGELQAQTSDGLTYTLRFGEVAYGSGFEVSAGVENPDELENKNAENRFLFITVEFNSANFEEPRSPNNTDFLGKADSLWSDEDRRNKELHDAHEEWKMKIENGKNISEELNDRFAGWYYVISEDSFKKLRLTRSDLIQEKTAS